MHLFRMDGRLNTMDVVESLHEIAAALSTLSTNIGEACYMINWIADGIQRELELAQERGRKQLS